MAHPHTVRYNFESLSEAYIRKHPDIASASEAADEEGASQQPIISADLIAADLRARFRDNGIPEESIGEITQEDSMLVVEVADSQTARLVPSILEIYLKS
jgi:hypothetical protein